MHYLLKKKAMDAMNEALNKPTEYPTADKTYDHPTWFKGTEPETIKHAAIDDYIRLADKIIADMKRLAEIAPKGGDIQALADSDSQDLQYFVDQVKGTPPGNHMARFRGSVRRAAVEMHNEPRVLPPRNELRSHLDQEVKDELKQEKEASKRTIALTQEQDQFWERCYEFYSNHGMNDDRAVRMADREMVKKWPELAKYRLWTDPVPPQ
jgi:hypothetical protein